MVKSNRISGINKLMSKSVQHLSIISDRNEYETPTEQYENACVEYDIHPEIDVCATRLNSKCKEYIDKSKNFLDEMITIKKPFFMNPPYDPEYCCNICHENDFDKIKRKQTINGKQRIKIIWVCKSCKTRDDKTKIHNGIKDFMKKAFNTSRENGVNALILTYAKTDTEWWHEYIENKAEIHFIKGRIKFWFEGEPTKYPAPYPSCWIIFKNSF